MSISEENCRLACVLYSIKIIASSHWIVCWINFKKTCHKIGSEQGEVIIWKWNVADKHNNLVLKGSSKKRIEDKKIYKFRCHRAMKKLNLLSFEKSFSALFAHDRTCRFYINVLVWSSFKNYWLVNHDYSRLWNKQDWSTYLVHASN